MNVRVLIDKANSLRRNGQNILADKIYDQLLSAEPLNDEVLFCKGLNLVETDPAKSILFFKRAVEVNPRATTAFENISAVAHKHENHEDAINAFNDLLRKYPNNLDVIFYRAGHIGMIGDDLRCLLDYYYIVDNSGLKNDAKTFLGHKISEGIALCKVEIRNKTINNKSSLSIDSNKYSGVKMKEYHYSLPAKLFGDENYVFDFGEMLGQTLKEVISVKPEYISWCILNIKNCCVGEEVIEMIKMRGVDTLQVEKINLFKLKILENQKPKLNIDDENRDFLIMDEDGNLR